jgi:hypothetical protein
LLRCSWFLLSVEGCFCLFGPAAREGLIGGAPEQHGRRKPRG